MKLQQFFKQNFTIILLLNVLLLAALIEGKKTDGIEKSNRSEGSERRWRREAADNCENPPPAMSDINASIKEDEAHKQNAQIASLIAQKAALEATEAEDAQSQAAAEAALEVKQELAERAEDAARAAQAALAGKQAVVDELEKEIKSLEANIKEQTEAEQRLEQTAKLAVDTACTMENVGKTLQNAMQLLEQAEATAHSVAENVQKEAELKCKQIDQSKNLLTQKIQELKNAHVDLEKTMDAAKKAVNAAKIAETNATRQKRFLFSQLIKQARESKH